MQSLPKEPGFHEINLEECFQDLFKYDCKIFDIRPISFPFDSPEELRKYLLEDHKTKTIILNDESGQFIGYFSYEDQLELPNMVELINLGVMPDQQNKGFGSKLMEKYLEIVGNRNSRLVTHPDSNSRYVYEKFGHKRVKIIKNYFGDGEPRVLYFRQSN